MPPSDPHEPMVGSMGGETPFTTMTSSSEADSRSPPSGRGPGGQHRGSGGRHVSDDQPAYSPFRATPLMDEHRRADAVHQNIEQDVQMAMRREPLQL